jgi:hypothetical protein
LAELTMKTNDDGGSAIQQLSRRSPLQRLTG